MMISHAPNGVATPGASLLNNAASTLEETVTIHGLGGRLEVALETAGVDPVEIRFFVFKLDRNETQPTAAQLDGSNGSLFLTTTDANQLVDKVWLFETGLVSTDSKFIVPFDVRTSRTLRVGEQLAFAILANNPNAVNTVIHSSLNMLAWTRS